MVWPIGTRLRALREHHTYIRPGTIVHVIGYINLNHHLIALDGSPHQVGGFWSLDVNPDWGWWELVEDQPTGLFVAPRQVVEAGHRFLLYKGGFVVSRRSALNPTAPDDAWTRQEIDDYIQQYNQRHGLHNSVFEVIPFRTVATITAQGVIEHV